MKNPLLILPCWLLVYVVYRGACVAIYDFCGWVMKLLED
jgi:hypothetical protein